jgi:hypothetical protein
MPLRLPVPNVTPQEADYYAMLSDWYAVGDDLNNALAHYQRTVAKQ